VGLGSSYGRFYFDNQSTDEFILKDCYVGINTDLPHERLQVNGQIVSDVNGSAATGGGPLNIWGQANASYLGFNYYYSGGAKYAMNGGGGYLKMDITSDDGDYVFYTAPTGTADNSMNVTERFRIKQDGQLIDAATYYDAVGGTYRDLYIDNTGLIGYLSSSTMYKRNIRNVNLEELISKVMALSPRIYDRIDGTINEIGLIAEEVNEIYPDIVSYKCKETIEENTIENRITGEKFVERRIVLVETDEPETVNYSKLITPLLIVVQEQQKQIAGLVERIDILENRK
jgi:hypothetical protein